MKFILLLLLSLSTSAETLTLDSYMNQVKETHSGYKGAVQQSEAALDRSLEGALQFSTNFFADVSHTDDKRPTISAAFQGNQTLIDRYSLGFSKQTTFGLFGKFSYNVEHRIIKGVDPRLVPLDDFYDSYFQLELVQPLWRNSFGNQLQARAESSRAQAMAAAFNQKHNAALIVAEAEARYWRLAIALRLVRLQQESYNRALEMKNFQERRQRQRLGEAVDLVQANASLKMRELELQNAQTEERLARKAFNEYRDMSAETPVETVLPSIDKLAAIPAPVFKGDKNDVTAARYNLKATQANMEIARDNQKPNLELYSTAATYGRNIEMQEAYENATTTRNPIYTLGVRFNINVDLDGTSTVRNAYLSEAQGAAMALHRTEREQTNSWSELTQRFHDARRRMLLASELEAAQKLKLNTERERHRQGRSTTYQIFLFEQDYVNSQIVQLQAISQILDVQTQMKVFEGGNK